jgi:hypothetical protein
MKLRVSGTKFVAVQVEQNEEIMEPIPLIGLILVAAAVIYYLVYRAKQKRGGEDKLINTDRPPLDIDNKTAGGGAPRDTFPGKT